MDSTSAPRRPGARGVPECVYITPGAPRDHQGLSGTGRRRPTGAVSGERSRVQTRIWTVFDRGAVKEEDWLRADDQDRFFRLGKVVGTPPRFQTSPNRSEEHTSELQSRYVISYAVFCLKKK